VITGVGTGAINGFILSLYEDHQIDGAIEELTKFWHDLATIDPFKFWKGGFVYGFFFEKSLYDASPIKEFI
jgi:predicted acylesterase/phospholipase RssA